MNLIIDTNIIVSALLTPDGRAFRLLSDVFDGKYIVFISQEVYEEYEEVLCREKFGFDEEIIAYILDWFKNNAIWAEVTKSSVFVPDEKDRIFYDIAKWKAQNKNLIFLEKRSILVISRGASLFTLVIRKRLEMLFELMHRDIQQYAGQLKDYGTLREIVKR